MIYDRCNVYDKSAFIDCLEEKVGLETEEIDAAMVDRSEVTNTDS